MNSSTNPGKTSLADSQGLLEVVAPPSRNVANGKINYSAACRSFSSKLFGFLSKLEAWQ